MEVLYPVCAGLDVHKDSVVASVRLAAHGKSRTEVRRFDTNTPGLLALSEWLTAVAHPQATDAQGASHVRRIQKTLEDANLKLASVLTDVVGVSGRAILQALIDGERDPVVLLTPVNRRVKAPAEKILAALTGRVTDRHRFLLRLHLRQIEALDAAITDIDQEVNRELDPSVMQFGCCAPFPASAI